jgi:hypothetical protein
MDSLPLPQAVVPVISDGDRPANRKNPEEKGKNLEKLPPGF